MAEDTPQLTDIDEISNAFQRQALVGSTGPADGDADNISSHHHTSPPLPPSLRRYDPATPQDYTDDPSLPIRRSTAISNMANNNRLPGQSDSSFFPAMHSSSSSRREHTSTPSTSSYASSQVSSNFTLSSTDDSSTSSDLFDHDRPWSDRSGPNAFASKLKTLYREITQLEAKVQKQVIQEDAIRKVRLKGKNPQSNSGNDSEQETRGWAERIDDHKRLASLICDMLQHSLSPSVPASLRNIPIKYNIIVRLWTFGFHKLLESLRRASPASQLALEHFQSFIYFGYAFYGGVLEEPPLLQFKSSWFEALGDLARYRITVINLMSSRTFATSTVNPVTASSVTGAGKLVQPHDAASGISVAPSSSIGVAAARAIELEPEVDRWRSIARDWYAKGLADQPGTGKLHHHLGMLSCDVPGEEIRSLYHSVKSMIALRPFPTDREPVLPIWSLEAQAKRQQPEAPLPALFVLLHGMLFSSLHLDEFRPTLSRFLERLERDGTEERVWIMMAVSNIGAVLEYNKPGGVLRKCGAISSRNLTSHESSTPDGTYQPVSFTYALELTFSILSHVLCNPLRTPSPSGKPRLNPYLTIILTFLVTILKHDKTLGIMEAFIPWDALASFFTGSIPFTVIRLQGLTDSPPSKERWPMITTKCSPPLPEDWCLRGMEWVGRKVFERGYWKSGEDTTAEITVLDEEVEEIDDGYVEAEPGDKKRLRNSKDWRRYVRIVRCAVTLADLVDGFTWVEGSTEWRVDGQLAERIKIWEEGLFKGLRL